MLVGCAGVGLSHFLIGLAYRLGFTGLPVLVLTLCAIACYAMSLAPVTWVLISEIFLPHSRRRDFYFRVGALDRFVPADLHVSDDPSIVWSGGYVLALRGNLLSWLFIYSDACS